MKSLPLMMAGLLLSSTLFAAAWDYDTHGPGSWATLSPEYKLCSDGQNQSPLNLTNMTHTEISAPSMAYHSSTGQVVDNGHAIQWTPDEKMNLVFKNQTYTLLQTHFHTPSEHTLNGVSFPAEAHLVHQNDTGDLLVIGVFFKSGYSNAFIDNMLMDLQNQKTSPLHPAGLLPRDKSIINYSGSLTTPPCSEGVTWVVMQTPATMSPSQLAELTSKHDGNARPTQAINARMILKEQARSR